MPKAYGVTYKGHLIPAGYSFTKFKREEQRSREAERRKEDGRRKRCYDLVTGA
jgi:hypothetical protein